MTLDQATRVRKDTILFLRERYVNGTGAFIDHVVECSYWKCLGEHVAVRIAGNIYTTFYPSELHFTAAGAME